MVEKVITYIPVSQEMLDDHLAWEAFQRRWRDATPEQREQWQREAAERRALERAASSRPLTLVALLDAMGWSEAYAEHLVQPYCRCGPDSDGGWSYCQHAHDLGLNS